MRDADVRALAETRDWLRKAVIGLNLCPFAKPAHTQNRIRYVASAADSNAALLDDLKIELLQLMATDPRTVETTLIVTRDLLPDFLDFNDFLTDADALIDGLGLTDDIQIASFHPRYRFAGSAPEDIENYTNRAPYPTLQLLREASVDRAIAEYGDTDEIYRKNIATLRRLGHAGWEKL